jgi:hypothetical protein
VSLLVEGRAGAPYLIDRTGTMRAGSACVGLVGPVFAAPTRSSTARSNSPAAGRSSASCPQRSRSGATGVRPATSRSLAARDRRFPVPKVPSPGLMPKQRRLPFLVGRRVPRFFLLDGGEPQDDVGMVFARLSQRGKTVRERTVQPNENLPCGWIDRLGVDALRQCRRDCCIGGMSDCDSLHRGFISCAREAPIFWRHEMSPALASCLAYRRSRKVYRALWPVSTCQSSAFSGQLLRGTWAG